MPRLASQNFNASLYTTGAFTCKLTTPIVPSPTGFSFGLWLKPLMVGNPTYHYMSYNSAAFTDGVIIARGAGKANLEVNIYNGLTNICGLNAMSNTAAKDSWIHVAVTYQPNGACKLYFNGNLQQSVTSTGTMSAAAAQTLVFGNRSYGDAPNGCNLSNIVWQNTTTPWTAQQVLDLYNKGTVPTGATAVYPLNEGAGTIAYDTSGNANDGTITLPTWTRDAPSKTRKAVNGNLVYNGDFEFAPPAATNVATTSGGVYVDGTSGGDSSGRQTIFGWFVWNYTTSWAAKFDTSVSYSGNASMKISTTATGSSIGLRASIHASTSFKQNNIPVLPNTSYAYSGWIKINVVSGSATIGARLQFATSTGANDVTTTTAVTGLVATQDWTQYTGTFTTAATARFVTPVLQIVGSDGAGTLIMDAWFDDITLTPTTATTRTALTKSRVKIQEDNYSVQWPTLLSGSGVATASAALQTLGVSNLNYSAGIWVKEFSRRATFGNIIFRLTAASPFRYAFQITASNNDRLQVNFYDGTLNPGVSSPKSYPIGSWYHVAFTREGTTVKLYINGVLSATQTITISTTTSNSVGLGTSTAFAGNVSDAFIYGSVLTADEIYAIYANDVYPSGALLKAKLNDGTGTTAADQSGNGVDFTLTTPTWSTDTATGKRTVVS